jgi:hypothetical protein
VGEGWWVGLGWNRKVVRFGRGWDWDEEQGSLDDGVEEWVVFGTMDYGREEFDDWCNGG